MNNSNSTDILLRSSQAKICLQAMTVKKEFHADSYDTMKKISELGLHYIEASQIEIDDGVINGCKDFNIQIAAVSAGFITPTASSEELAAGVKENIKLCKKLNCSYVRIGMLPYYFLKDKASIHEFAVKAETAALEFLKEGIYFYYHNHHVEFQKINNKFLLTYLTEEAPHLGIELDVHWAQRGGVSPLKLIRELRGRIDLLHLKDYRIKRISPETAVSDRYTDFSNYFSSVVEFAEVGEGSLDMKEIIEAGLTSGTKFLIIEQDDTYGRNPFESIQLSIQNLRNLGYGSYL